MDGGAVLATHLGLLPDARVDDGGPSTGADFLALVHANAGHMPGIQQGSDGPAVPRLATGGLDPPAVEILRDRRRPLPLQVAVEHLSDNLRLFLDDRHPARGVPEPPDPALRLAFLGPVLHGRLQPPRGVIGRTAGMRDLDTQDEAVVGVRQIPPVRLPVQRDRVVVGDLEQFFQVTRLPHQPIRVVRDDVSEPALTRRPQQFVPARPLPLPAPRRATVVDEYVGLVHGEPATLGDLTADPLLAVDAGLVVVLRLGDPAVDRRRLAGCGAGGPCGALVAAHANECTNTGWPG